MHTDCSVVFQLDTGIMPLEQNPQGSVGFPGIGHFNDLAGQGAGLPCLDHAIDRKSWTEVPSNLVFYNSTIILIH